MADITKEIFDLLNIPKEERKFYTSYVEDSGEYKLNFKTEKDGKIQKGIRTYSPSSLFNGKYALSKIEGTENDLDTNIYQDFVSEKININVGKDKDMTLWRNRKGNERTYATDPFGSNQREFLEVKILEDGLDSILKTTGEDLRYLRKSYEAYVEEGKMQNQLFNQTQGKEGRHFSLKNSPYDFIINKLIKVNEMTQKEADFVQHLIDLREKDSEQRRQYALKRTKESLNDLQNDPNADPADIAELEKRIIDIQNNQQTIKDIKANGMARLEKAAGKVIDQTTKARANVISEEKRIKLAQKRVKKIASMYGETVANVVGKKTNINKKKQFQIPNELEDIAKIGISTTGKKDFTPKKSNYATLNNDFIKEVKKAEKINVGKEYDVFRTNKKNPYTMSNERVQNTKADDVVVTWDLETIGEIGGKYSKYDSKLGRSSQMLFTPTQLAITRKEKDGTTNTKEFIFQMEEEAQKWIHPLIEKIGTDYNFSEEERRYLLSLAGLSRDEDGIVKAKHLEFGSQVDLSKENLKLKKKIIDGFEALANKDGKSTNLRKISELNDIMEKETKDADVVTGSNTGGYDTEGFKDLGVSKAVLEKMQSKAIDILQLARSNIAMGAKGKNGKRLFSYKIEDLADYYGITQQEIKKRTNGLTQHTAAYDTVMESMVYEKIIEEVKQKQSQNPIQYNQQTLKENLIGTANKTTTKRSNYSFRTDASGKLRDDDYLFFENDKYSFDGEYQKEIDGVIRKFTKWTNQVTGDVSYSYMDDYTTVTDQVSEIFGDNDFVDSLSARDKALSMLPSFFEKGGLRRLSQVLDGNGEDEAIKNQHAILNEAGNEEIKQFLSRIRTLVGHGTNSYNVQNILMKEIGDALGIRKKRDFTSSKILENVKTEGMSVQNLKDAYLNYITANKKRFKKGFNIKEALKAVKQYNITDEQLKSGKKGFYGIDTWLFDNLLDEEKIKLNKGAFSEKAINYSEEKLKGIINPIKERNKKRFSPIKDSVYSLYNTTKKNKNDNIKRISKALSGEDIIEDLQKVGVNTDNIKSDFYAPSNDGTFGKGSLGNIIYQFISEMSGQEIGTHLQLADDGKSLKIGVFNNDDVEKIKDSKGNTLWDQMAGVVDIDLGLDGTLSASGIDVTNYFAPYYNKHTKKVEFQTERESVARQVLNVLKNERTIERIKKGENIQGSINARKRRALSSASSGGTYKNYTSSFLDEAKDAIRVGATPEQMATRRYTIAMENLIADIAEDSGYELGQGFERTENLKALMLYATALSYGDDFASTIENVPMIKGPTINGEIARDKFKEKIKPLVEMGGFSLEGIKEQSYLTQHAGYVGARNFDPHASLNSAQGRNLDQFFNYLERNRSKEMREEGYANGMLKNNFSVETGRRLLGDNYAQSDIYDRFIVGYSDDNSLFKLKNDLQDSEKRKKLFEGVDVDTQDKILKFLESNPSIFEGGALVSKTASKHMNAYRSENKDLNINDFKYDKEFQNKLDNLKIGDSLDLEDQELNNDLMFGKLELNKGDILKNIIKIDDNTFNLSYKKREEAEAGKKFIGGGNRQTISAVVDDPVMEWLTKQLGISGAHIISEHQKLKGKNATEIIGGRIDLIINSFINKEIEKQKEIAKKKGKAFNEGKAKDKIAKQIESILNSSKSEVNELFNRMYQYNAKTHTWDTNFLYTKDGLMYKNKNGELSSLFDDKITKDFLYGNGSEDNKNFTELLGFSIWGNEYNRNLTSQAVALSNVYTPAHPTGQGSEEYINKNSHYKIGPKERAAIKSRLNFAKFAYINQDGEDFEELDSYFDDYAGVKDENNENIKKSYEQALEDNLFLWKSNSEYLENSFGEGTIDSNQIFEIFADENDIAGEKTDNRFTLSDIYSSEYGDLYGGNMSEEDFINITRGRIVEKIKKAGGDPEKAKVVLRMGDKGVRIGKDDKFGRDYGGHIRDLVLPMGSLLKGHYKYTEMDKSINSLFRTLLNYNDIEDKDLAEKFTTEAVQSFISNLYSSQDKNQSLYKDLNTKKVGSSMSGATAGINMNIKDDDNSVYVNEEDFAQMLDGIDVDTLEELYNASDFGGNYSGDKTQEAIIGAITAQIKNGKSFWGIGHRYPSTDSEAMLFQHVRIGENLKRGQMRLGHGMATAVNADYDGDKYFLSLPFTDLKGKSQEEINEIIRQFNEVRELNDQSAKLLGDWTRSNFMEDSIGVLKRDEEGNLITDENGNYIREFFDKNGEVSTSISTPEEELLLTMLSKHNFGGIGSFSNFATKYRNVSRSKGLETKFDTEEGLKTLATTKIARAVFELTEQDTISAKKVGQRIAKLKKAGKDVEADKLITGLQEYSQILHSYDYDKKYSNTREAAERKSLDLIEKGIEIGIFKNDENATLSGRQAASAISTIQSTLAKQMGKDIYDSEVIEKLASEFGITGIQSKNGEVIGGNVSKEGLLKYLTEAQMQLGGVSGFLNAINSEEAKRGVEAAPPDSVSKRIADKYKKKANYYRTGVADSSESSEDEKYSNYNSPDGIESPMGNIGNLAVDTITANTIIVNGEISNASSKVIEGSNLGSKIDVTGSGRIGVISGASSNEVHIPTTPFDLSVPVSKEDYRMYAESVLRHNGINPFKGKINQKYNPAVLTEMGHQYRDSQGKLIEYDYTASQAFSSMDPTKSGGMDPSIKFVQDVIGSLAEGTTQVKIEGYDEPVEIKDIDDLVKKTGNKDLYTTAKGVVNTTAGTAVHKMMELLLSGGSITGDTDKNTISGLIENIFTSKENKEYFDNISVGLKKMGYTGNAQDLIKNNVMELISLYQSVNSDILKEGVVPSTEQSGVLEYFTKNGTSLKIAGTFDAALTEAMMDWKNESNLNTASHAVQLDILTDMLMQRDGISEDQRDKIREMIFAKLTGNKNLSTAAETFRGISDEDKAVALNLLKANSVSKPGMLSGTVIDGAFRKHLPSLMSEENNSAYFRFLKEQNQMDGRDFISRIQNEDNGFYLSSEKETKDGNIERTFTYFDEATKKLLSIVTKMDSTGKFISSNEVYEKDYSKEYDNVRGKYLEQKTSIIQTESIINDLKSELNSLIENGGTEDDITSLKHQLDEAINNLATQKALHTDFARGINPELLKGLEVDKDVINMQKLSKLSSEWDGKEGTESANARELLGILENLRMKYDSLTSATKQFNEAKKIGLDVSESDFGINQLNDDIITLEETLKRITSENANSNLSPEILDTANKMANMYKDSAESEMAQTNPERSKDITKRILDYEKRIGELQREKAQYEGQKGKHKGRYGTPNKTIQEKINAIDAEIARLSELFDYDEKTGVAKVKQKIGVDSEGKPQYSDKNDVVKLSGDEKKDFDSNIAEEREDNYYRIQKIKRDNLKPGFFERLASSFSNSLEYMVGNSIGYSIIGMARGQITKIIQLTTQLDKTMTDLSIVTGKNRKEVTNLMKSYNGLAKSMGLTTAEVSASANEWLRMGYKTNDINTLIKNSAMLAKLGMIEMGQATEYLTSAIKGYGVAVEDSSSIVDMATSLDMKYAVSAGYILEAMSRTATSAKLAKVEMADLQSMIAIIGETSQKDASVVGESLKTAFSRYGNVKAGVFSGNSDYTSLSDQYEYESIASELGEDINVNDIEKVLKQVGVTLRNGTEWNSYSDILKKVGENFQKMSDYEKNAITTAMFGTRQRENGLILLENYNEVMEASKIANESAGTATAKYIKYQDSLEAATNRVTSAFEKFVLELQGSGTIKNFLSVVATSLEHIHATLIATAGVSIILNLEKVLKLLTLLSTKARTLSVSTLWDGVHGKGSLGEIFKKSTEDRYKMLDDSDPYYVKRQIKLFKNSKNNSKIVDMKDMQKQIVTANTISTIRGGIDMVVGSQILSEIGQGIANKLGQDEATWQAIGSMIGLYAAPQLSSAIGETIASKIGFGPVGASGISAIITATMGAVLAFYNWQKKQAEKAEKEQAEKVETSKERIDQYASLTTQNKFKRYDELAKGINQYGNNISLTSSEYDEFISLGNELAQEFDSLVIGTDKFGNSLVGADGAIGGLSEASEELLKIEKEKLYKAKLEKPEKGDSLIDKAFENYKTEVDNVYDSWFRKDNLDSDTANNFGNRGVFKLISDPNSSSMIAQRKFVKSSKSKEGKSVGEIISDSAFNTEKDKKYSKSLDERLELISKKYNKRYWEENKITTDEEKSKQFFKVQSRGDGIEIILPDSVETGSEIGQGFLKEVNNQIDLVNKESIKDFNEEIRKIKEEFTKDFLPAILNLNPIWEQLGENTQSFVSKIAAVIDLETAGIKTGDDYRKYIEDNILSNLDESKVEDYEKQIKAFSDKEHLGIELTLAESSDEYNATENVVKNIYSNYKGKEGKDSDGNVIDNAALFRNTASQMGYVKSSDGKSWTKDNITYTLQGEKGKKQWIGIDEDGNQIVMDDAVYSRILGQTNKAKDILDEIITKSGINEDERSNLENNLTIEEAEWVAKHSSEWLSNRSANEIIQAAQTEQLTAMSTIKSRIDDKLEEKGLYNEFEKLIDAGYTFEQIKKELGDKADEDFYQQLGLLNDRANTLGISLKEAYNQAVNLSSIDKFGMTNKTVSSIVSESENMMNIAMGAIQGNVSAELITYLQVHAPELLMYSGNDLANEIMKSQGMTTLIGASLKNTLGNSNEFFDKIYRDIGITTSTAWSSQTGDFLTGTDFTEHIKNYKDMLEFQDYFSSALVTNEDGTKYYSPEKIQQEINENDVAKEWLTDQGITGDGIWNGDIFAQAAAYGKTLQDISSNVESEMKNAIAEHIKSVSEFNVNQASRAFKDLTKNIEDLNEQLKDLEKQNAINKLNNELERLTINIDGLDKKISLFDWGFDHLAEADYFGKNDVLGDKLTALTEKNKTLAESMDYINSKTPTTAEEAEALKQKYDELSSSYIENEKAIMEVQEKMESLGATMLESSINQSFEALNKQATRTSNFVALSRLSTYTGGAEGLLNYNLSGTLKSKNEIDKKKSEYEKLLDMQKEFNEKSLELHKTYLDLKAKQDAKDYNKQKSNLVESQRDARVEFYQQYGHILIDRLGSDEAAMKIVGITKQDLINYYKSSLGISSLSDSEASELANSVFTSNSNSGANSGSGSNSGSTPSETDAPKMKGTNTVVDTPENVSDHITSTMESGIKSANEEMANDTTKYGVKAPSLDKESWGNDGSKDTGGSVNKGLGLIVKNAYESIIDGLNTYINSDESTKLISPKLNDAGKRGWGANNTTKNSLMDRMKTRINACIEALNTYISSDSGVGKLVAPDVDQKSWEKFGIVIGKYIYDGIQYALGQGIEFDLDSLLSKYNEDHRFKSGIGGPDNSGSKGILTSKSSSLQTLISQALGKDLVPQLLETLNPFTERLLENLSLDFSSNFSNISEMGWVNPLSGGKLTSKYGYRTHPIYKTKKFHEGIDIAAPLDTPIYAVADGVITAIGDNGGYGKSISILHDGGYVTTYNHMNGYNSTKDKPLTVGTSVKQNQKIGYVGQTGLSTGPHLHFNVFKNGVKQDPLNYIPGYAQGTKTHQGGLALVGDEGLFKHSSKAFPEIVILPDGKISLMGTEGPVLANLPKGTEVLNNSDTKKMININSYADGTDTKVEKKEEEKKEKTEEEYKKGWTEYLDDLLKVDERTVALLTENFNKNNEKIPHLNELSNLEKSIYDPVVRGSYQREIELYGQKDDIDYYKKLSDNAKELRNEAMYNLRLAIEKGASLTELQALENIAEKAQEEFEKNEQAIESSVKSLTEAFTNFAEKINDVYENIKTNLDFSYNNGLIGEKTNDNYYNILRVYSENRVKDLNKNLEDAIKRITDAYIEIGYSTEVAYSKAMESSEIMNIKRDRDQAINDRKQIEIDANQNAIAKYERANSRIEERLGYNSDLLDTQFGEVFETRMKNTKSMIEEDKRFLAENENLSYEQRNEIIDRINTNTKAMITDTSNLINNILNNSKKRVEASVNEREKQLSVGGIRNSEKIYTKNIKDFEKEAEAIVQALADTKSKLREEAILNGLTNEKDIEEYINNHSEIISLNEQYLDTLKKQAEEHKKILDYTVQRLDNEKELLDLSKENEWASISNIQDYYASMDDILDGQIQAQKEYMRSNYLSEDEYNQAKIKLANLQREKFNNDLQRMQDVQSFYNKQYEAMNYIINEYISALNDEKDNIAETYDDEIEKLEKISNTKERIIKLTELQNNLDNAQNEKKRVYRAGVGFVYEQDREAIKKAKDELDNFYEQDQIDNLNKAKEMESKILDDRIEKWQKYLESIEKIYKTAERNENINILENLLGVEGWHGIFNELNTDMEGFIKKYDDGSKIYQGLWDNFLKNYEILSTKIYNKLKESVDVLRSIPKFSTSDVTPDDKKVSDDVKNLNNTNYFDPEIIKKYGSWKDPSRRYIRDFKGVAKSKELQEKYNMDKDAAEYYHEQKWAELFDFYSKNQELVENIVLGKANNTTEYSIPELLDSIYTGYVKLYKDGMLSLEELESRMDVFTLASENIAIENIDLKKKKDSIKSLLNNNVDIQAILNETNPYISGKWTDSTTGLNKDELIATRVYKIWRKFADTDELKVYNSDGSYNHEESLKNLINMIQPSLEENYDINVNGPLGDLIDIIEDYVHQGKLAQNTTIEDVSKAANSWQETEKTLKGFSLLDMSPTGVPQIAEETPMNSNNNVFNVTNFMLTKDDNGYSKLPEAIEQQASINNHAN